MAGQVGYLCHEPTFIDNAHLIASLQCEKDLAIVLFIQWLGLHTDSKFASMLSTKHRDYKYFLLFRQTHKILQILILLLNLWYRKNRIQTMEFYWIINFIAIVVNSVFYFYSDFWFDKKLQVKAGRGPLSCYVCIFFSNPCFHGMSYAVVRSKKTALVCSFLDIAAFIWISNCARQSVVLRFFLISYW